MECFPREEWRSCSIQNEELFTLEKLKRASQSLKANAAPGIDGIPNEILKEVIRVYPYILLEAFNSYLHEGRFFTDWKRQRMVLFRKGEKPLDKPSTFRPICLLDTMGKLLEDLILQRHMQDNCSLSENQFGFRKGRSTIDVIQAVVDIAMEAERGAGKQNVFCALINIEIGNTFNPAKWKICVESMMRKKVPDYKRQVGDLRGRYMDPQRGDDMWRPSGIAGRSIRVECHV